MYKLVGYVTYLSVSFANASEPSAALDSPTQTGDLLNDNREMGKSRAAMRGSNTFAKMER